MTSPCKANAQNAPRQFPILTKYPPINGPHSEETPHIAEITAITLTHSFLGNSVEAPMNAKETNPPPPMPCRRRPKIIIDMSGA